MNSLARQKNITFAGTREDLLNDQKHKVEKELADINTKIQGQNLSPHIYREYQKRIKELQAELDKIRLESEKIRAIFEKKQIPMPEDCFLNDSKRFRYIGLRGGFNFYIEIESNHLYSWDDLHGEVEWFSTRPSRRHLGVFTPEGVFKVGSIVKGRNASYVD